MAKATKIARSTVVKVGDIKPALEKIPKNTDDPQLKKMRNMIGWPPSASVNLVPQTIEKLTKLGYEPPEVVNKPVPPKGGKDKK